MCLIQNIFLLNVKPFSVDQDSSVSMAICYGLDGSGIETRWQQDFPYPYRPALGTTRSPVQGVLIVFPGFN
jgi:hypothetical protein